MVNTLQILIWRVKDYTTALSVFQQVQGCDRLGVTSVSITSDTDANNGGKFAHIIDIEDYDFDMIWHSSVGIPTLKCAYARF
jgi:hypothetical protein